MNLSEPARFRSLVEELSGLGHLGSGTQRERAAALIQTRLAELGLSSELQPFAGSHAWAARFIAYVVPGALALFWLP